MSVVRLQGLETLEWLRLDGNLIESLPTAGLSPLRSVRGIELHHNPWNCTCSLRPLRSWLAARNMPFSVPPLCLSPVRLRGQSWNRMPLDELACPPLVQPVEALVQASAGQPATLACSVKSNPEAAVAWFFADRLIVNLTGDEANPHQVYSLKETGDRTDRVVQLVLNAAREQDSGFYVCQAANRADRASANVTLLVRGGEVSSGRGFTAGLILAVFAVLIGVLLVCCVCSLRRARSHASLRTRRRASSASNLQPGGLFDKPLESFGERLDEERPSLRGRSNGAKPPPPTPPPPDGDDASGTPPECRLGEPTRFADKQWLVSREPDARASPPMRGHPTRQSSVASTESTEGHRQIAMYQNQKVLFNSPSPSAPLRSDRSSLSPAGSHSVLSLSSQQQAPARNYPDLVDVLPAPVDYEPSDVASVDDELDPRRQPLVENHYRHVHRRYDQGRRLSVAESSGSTCGSLLNQRRRPSDWELGEMDANEEWVAYSYHQPHQSDLGYDSEVEAASFYGRDEFEEDFQRRYAYHTGQLNRFLFEYRTLQKKLARMQDTWGRCLDAPDLMAGPRRARPAQYAARPLRPILKNRLAAPIPVRPPPPAVRPDWPAAHPAEEIVDPDSPPTPVNESPTDETYFS